MKEKKNEIFAVSQRHHSYFRKHFQVLLAGTDCRKDNALRERLRTHKVFTKDQSFYLNYHKFSIKLYVLDLY